MSILDRIPGFGRRERDGKNPGSRLQDLVREARKAPWGTQLADHQTAAPLLTAPVEDQIEAVHLSLDLLDEYDSKQRTSSGLAVRTSADCQARDALLSLVKVLLQRDLPFREEDLVAILVGRYLEESWFPWADVVDAVERVVDDKRPAGKLNAALESFRDALRHSGARQLYERVRRILHGAPEPLPAFEPIDAWSAKLCEILDSLDPANQDRWHTLLAHAKKAKSAKPTNKWLHDANRILEGLGVDSFARVFVPALEAVGTDAPFPLGVRSWDDTLVEAHPRRVLDRFSDCLRGLIWTASLTGNNDFVALLGSAAERCFKKLPDHGPLAPKIGNACLHALAGFPFREAAAQLTRLRTRARHASVRRQIEKTLGQLAEKAGLSPEDLEEIGVPTCGLTDIGRRIEDLGEFQARFEVTGVHPARLSWRRKDGKTQKSVPAAIKSDFPEKLASLKLSAAEVKKLLPAQRDRIECMLLSRRTLAHGEWADRYLNHPLVGYLTRRLLWCVGDDVGYQVAACHPGHLADIAGRGIPVTEATPIRLWHPIDSSVETVRAWRGWFTTNHLTQPFKQAHREIYVLTDAERATGTYSNRFAAHILKQHKFHALLQQRGWQYTLQGDWDSHNTPHINLPDQEWRVEFWVDPAGDPRQDVTDAGVYHCVATDQVRFHRMREHEPQRLDRVPKVLFSELMRDVDLFVGVCSVGNDPTWNDGGPERRYADYWSSYAFGDLGESAKIRREVLAELIPKLKIADRCTLEGNFLTVRGEIRSYRIHLGSGNILMSPNDQYLCIVLARKADGTPADVMLPFEGDSMLSIILSKAFLLAEDKRIKDPIIVQQIRWS